MSGKYLKRGKLKNNARYALHPFPPGVQLNQPSCKNQNTGGKLKIKSNILFGEETGGADIVLARN